MSGKWTPGPWSVRAPLGFHSPRVYAADGRLIAEFGNAENDLDRIDADAHMGAAAPDLYKALAEWFAQYDGWNDAELAKRADPATIKRVHQTRAALAKARGEVLR